MAMPSLQEFETNNFWPSSVHLLGYLKNPQHVKLLPVSRNLYDDLIALTLAQQRLAQGRLAADDLNVRSTGRQLHVAAIRAEKELLLPVVGIHQTDQRTELDTLAGVVGVRAELAPMGDRLADGVSAPGLARGEVGGFETQGVVFVFGNILCVGRRFMRCTRGLLGLLQVFGQALQHLLLQQQFIHHESQVSLKNRE